MSRKSHLRRLSVLVTAQTLYNLECLRQMGELQDMGRVVDKLTREKMIALHGDHKNQMEKGAQKWSIKQFCEQR